MNKYKKDENYSYSFGAFVTYELLENKPESAIKVLLSEKLNSTPELEKVISLAKKHNIEIETNEKLIRKIADKDNIFIVGVFEKYSQKIEQQKNHVVLVNPSDMGNMGTIIRTMAGFNMKDLAIIAPCCDIFNPKTIRASMGAIFKTNIQIFDSFEQYMQNHPANCLYPFMLNGTTTLQNLQTKKYPFSLVFGNEATGLAPQFINYGQSIVINHTNRIDSLNLPISVSMALYEFTREKFLNK